MNLTSLALRNLRRRPVRSGLSILGIGLAVGCALALMSLSHSIKDSTRAGLDEMVLICQGSSARLTPETEKLPIDAVVIGLVDTVDVGGKVILSTRAS